MIAASLALALLAVAQSSALPTPVSPEAVFAHGTDAAHVARALATATVHPGDTQVFSGDFEQATHLRGLPKPLQARGSFLLIRDLGVIWHTTEPAASDLIMTRDALVQRSALGARVRTDTRRQPIVRSWTRVLPAILSLDVEQLARHFTMSLHEAADGGWQIGLRPREDIGATKAIVIAGHHELEHIELFEHGGDRVTLDLHDVSRSMLPADSTQRARFE
ncbi:outer membrane lipoprotein carrier protein LolA [Solimonas marina]|uniref:Outer membrane lipoprotein carrier protein LolA n=1 Tax=Solimonas marina TaxID=2714601 RepID=A0A970B3H4_9GAMM|nr:outer membrane lipoprotein carrier protein LolA [Solimonas marina]NKF21247.1 outer membrane lipoprotein carrier protein LolA [Solimonas marina]